MAYEPLSDDLLTRMIEITLGAESGNRDYDAQGRPITSPKGARYAMQTMPATAGDPGFGVRPARSNTPAEFNRVGRDYLKAMYQRYGSPDKTWAAYNAGPGRLDAALGGKASLPRETRNYVAANMKKLGLKQPGRAMEPEDEVAMDGEAPVTGGLSALSGGDYTPQLLELQKEMMSVQERQRQTRQQQLAEATELLRSRRLGPSRSEQLMQLSAAMLQPRRYKGFGSTISNFLPVLAQQQADRREGETARADALLKLQQQYQNADMDSETGAIKSRMDLLKIAAQASRGNQPSIQLDEQGNLREVPKSNNVYRPTTPEEYAAIPRGAWYVVPGGVKAGTVVRKQ